MEQEVAPSVFPSQFVYSRAQMHSFRANALGLAPILNEDVAICSREAQALRKELRKREQEQNTDESTGNLMSCSVAMCWLAIMHERANRLLFYAYAGAESRATRDGFVTAINSHRAREYELRERERKQLMHSPKLKKRIEEKTQKFVEAIRKGKVAGARETSRVDGHGFAVAC